ncbi:MAG TPA: LrgB family protein [Candidatus Alistipes pullicola]|nr:LrgB family protein [Candidatus Alistipes pullicola]
MQELINSQIFLLTLTVGVYLGAIQLRRKINFALLHPVFVSILVLIVFIRLTGIEYEHYMQQTQIIDFMLGLSVVALGYILHDQIYNIRGNVISIVMAILVGSAVGIVSVALIARWMGAEPAVVASLEPKSVTTAIALSVSANSGGIPALTSVVVIVVGVFGGIVGPWVLKKIGVESRIAKGLAMGAAAHALGTARAMELGAVEGAISGLAIGLMGLATAVLVPILEKIM